MQNEGELKRMDSEIGELVYQNSTCKTNVGSSEPRTEIFKFFGSPRKSKTSTKLTRKTNAKNSITILPQMRKSRLKSVIFVENMENALPDGEYDITKENFNSTHISLRNTSIENEKNIFEAKPVQRTAEKLKSANVLPDYENNESNTPQKRLTRLKSAVFDGVLNILPDSGSSDMKTKNKPLKNPVDIVESKTPRRRSTRLRSEVLDRSSLNILTDCDSNHVETQNKPPKTTDDKIDSKTPRRRSTRLKSEFLDKSSLNILPDCDSNHIKIQNKPKTNNDIESNLPRRRSTRLKSVIVDRNSLNTLPESEFTSTPGNSVILGKLKKDTDDIKTSNSNKFKNDRTETRKRKINSEESDESFLNSIEAEPIANLLSNSSINTNNEFDNFSITKRRKTATEQYEKILFRSTSTSRTRDSNFSKFSVAKINNEKLVSNKEILLGKTRSSGHGVVNNNITNDKNVEAEDALNHSSEILNNSATKKSHNNNTILNYFKVRNKQRSEDTSDGGISKNVRGKPVSPKKQQNEVKRFETTSDIGISKNVREKPGSPKKQQNEVKRFESISDTGFSKILRGSAKKRLESISSSSEKQQNVVKRLEFASGIGVSKNRRDNPASSKKQNAVKRLESISDTSITKKLRETPSSSDKQQNVIKRLEFTADTGVSQNRRGNLASSKKQNAVKRLESISDTSITKKLRETPSSSDRQQNVVKRLEFTADTGVSKNRRDNPASSKKQNSVKRLESAYDTNISKNLKENPGSRKTRQSVSQYSEHLSDKSLSNNLSLEESNHQETSVDSPTKANGCDRPRRLTAQYNEQNSDQVPAKRGRGRPRSSLQRATKINVAKQLPAVKKYTKLNKLTKEQIKTNVRARKIPKDRLDDVLNMFNDNNHPIWHDRNTSCNPLVFQHWNCNLNSDLNIKIKYARQFLLRRDWFNLSKILGLFNTKGRQYFPLLTKYGALLFAHTNKELFDQLIQYVTKFNDSSAAMTACTQMAIENSNSF